VHYGIFQYAYGGSTNGAVDLWIPVPRIFHLDTHFTIEDVIAEGDKVVTRWTARGTHKGELQGIPPTGKQVVVTGIVINRLVNGKLEEGWSNFDALGMLQQLGVIPSMG
jgi:predicted ester cyclase